MKSLFIDRILRRNIKAKAKAEEDKKRIAESKSQIKNQPKETVTNQVEVMKESKTLMLD